MASSGFTVSLLMCWLLSSASARPFTFNDKDNYGKQQGVQYLMPQKQGWRLPTTKELEMAAKEEGLYYPYYYANALKQGFERPFSKEQRLGSEQGFAYELSQQQGRSVPFGEEQGRRIQLPQAQKWYIKFRTGQGVPNYTYEQETSKINKLFKEMTDLLTQSDEKLSQQQWRSIPYALEQDTSDEVSKLSEEATNLLIDKKLSQQQGRSVPFGEKEKRLDRRIQLPQKQNWHIRFGKGQVMRPIPFAHEQEKSDEVNKLSEEVANLLTQSDEKLSQKQARSIIPYALEQDTSDEVNNLSEEATNLLTDEKLSQQQGRYIPFGEEQGRRIQLHQKQSWQIPLGQDLYEKITKLLADEKLSQQQGRSIPFGEEQGRRIQLPQKQSWQSPLRTGQDIYEEITNLLTDEKLSQQQGRSAPLGKEQGKRIQLPQKK